MIIVCSIIKISMLMCICCACIIIVVIKRTGALGPVVTERRQSYLGIHYRGVQWEGGAVDSVSIIQ